MALGRQRRGRQREEQVYNASIVVVVVVVRRVFVSFAPYSLVIDIPAGRQAVSWDSQLAAKTFHNSRRKRKFKKRLGGTTRGKLNGETELRPMEIIYRIPTPPPRQNVDERPFIHVGRRNFWQPSSPLASLDEKIMTSFSGDRDTRAVL